MPPQTLVTAVRERTVVPFVGSGLSVSAGRHIFPDWSGLIERLAARLALEGLAGDAADVRTHLAAKRFREAAELAFEKLTPSRFGMEMQAAFDVPVPHDADLSAVEALWRLRPRTVITTNYDAVLRWPFAAHRGQPYQLARMVPRVVHNDDPGLLQQLAAPSDGDRPSIWHLHGSVDRPGTTILTQRQYERLYGAGSRQLAEYAFALDQLRSLVANRTLLFVGFSLDDPFVRAQLEYIFAVTAKQNPVSFVLLKKGQKNAAALLDHQHVQIIEFEDFGPPMVRAIGEIADEAWGHTAVAVSVPGALVGLVDDLKIQLRKVAPQPAVVGRAFNRWRPPAWPTFPLGGDGVGLALDAVDKLANAMRQGGGYTWARQPPTCWRGCSRVSSAADRRGRCSRPTSF